MAEKKDRNPDADKQSRPAGEGEPRAPGSGQSDAVPPTPDSEASGFDTPVVMWEDEEPKAADRVEEPANNADSLETPGKPAPFHEISSFLSQQGTGEQEPAGTSGRTTEPAAAEGPGTVPPRKDSAEGRTPSTGAQGDLFPEGTSLTQPGFYQPVTAHDEPFFEIPDEMPLLPGEDTEESPALLEKKERIRRRSNPLWTITNIVSWSVLVLFCGAIVYVLLYYRYASGRLRGEPASSETRTVDVVIKPRETFNQILEELRRKKLLSSYLGIDDKYLMKYLAKVNGDSDKIKAGFYRFNTSMGLSDIYEKLGQGSQDFKITIPEGKTCREIARIAKRKNDQFNEDVFLQKVKDPAFIATLEPYIGKLQEPSLEGYLYPNTYSYGPGMKEEELIRMMVKTFRDTVDERLEGIVRHDNYNFHQHLTMASLIEREARIDTDRPLIASVIFNRLDKGMPLQIDASVLYALDDWKHELTHADLKIDSPYNTYKVKGLPPGPICNPRVESIVATYEPANTRFLFYVYKGDGSHAFAETFEQHKRNVQLYRKSHPSLLDAPETAVIATPTPESTKTAVAAANPPAPVSTTTSITQVQSGAKETTSVSQIPSVKESSGGKEAVSVSATKAPEKSPAAEESPAPRHKDSKEKNVASEKTKAPDRTKSPATKGTKRSGAGRKGSKNNQ